MDDEIDDESRTEPPTQRRREEARAQGQVAVSSELTSGLLLLTGVLVLWLGGERFAGGLLELVQEGLRNLQTTDLGPEAAQGIMTQLASRAAQLLSTFMGTLFAVALGVGAMQVGIHMVPSLVSPNWQKISPGSGWRRIFSVAAMVRGVIATLRVILVASVAAWVLRGRWPQLATLGEGTVSYGTAQAWSLGIRTALAVAATLALLGIIDYTYQRFRFERSLRMSRQELKEEIKREEGDPQIKARLRRMAREMAKHRMLQEVPRATVVITNPTHLAVALRYDRGRMTAPRVVAKGAGLVAQKIADIARRHAVPVVERKPVAQALFKAVAIGQDIPAALYVAVAEILASIYRLRTAS